MIAAVPVTLASATVWTRRAGGDDSIAMLITIITNAACFLLTPLWMYWISSLQIERELLYGTIIRLLLFVVLPMAAAQAVRGLSKPVGRWSIRRKPLLSALAQAGVLMMVLIGAIKTGLQFSEGKVAISFTDVLITIGICAIVHLAAMAVAILISRACRLPPEQQIAVGISGSQKTLMVGLSAATSPGVTIIPLVVYQVFQLTVDTMIADWWRSRNS